MITAAAAIWRWGFWLRLGPWLVGVDWDAPPLYSERVGPRRAFRIGRWRVRAHKEVRRG